jgi:hypothetical protein
MSKTANSLQKMERGTYRDWTLAVRELGQMRNRLILAAKQDIPDAKSRLELATAYADACFNKWTTVCNALDEIEQAGLNGSRGT